MPLKISFNLGDVEKDDYLRLTRQVQIEKKCAKTSRQVKFNFCQKNWLKAEDVFWTKKGKTNSMACLSDWEIKLEAKWTTTTKNKPS